MSIGFVLPTKPTAFAERGKTSPITPISQFKNLTINKIKFEKELKKIREKIHKNWNQNCKKGCGVLWEIEI